MKRVLIVGSQHGNELLGEKLYRYITRQPQCDELCVEYMLANPKARDEHVRYLESDMNRSFTGYANTYEEQCAQKLLAYLSDKQFDLVIDAHTTTVSQAPCIIVPAIDDGNVDYLRATHIKNIVIMKYEFVGRSLIGNVPRSVSLEISNQQLRPGLYENLYQELVNFAHGTGHYPAKLVFGVDDVIEKAKVSLDSAKELRNFQRSREGYYPVLVGENSYKKQTNYLGFRASTKRRVTIASKPHAISNHQL